MISPSPPLLLMCNEFCPGLQFENLWGLSLMVCNFNGHKQNRGIEVFSKVLLTSLCPCLSSVSGCQERGVGRVYLGLWMPCFAGRWTSAPQAAVYDHDSWRQLQGKGAIPTPALHPHHSWCCNKLKHMLCEPPHSS